MTLQRESKVSFHSSQFDHHLAQARAMQSREVARLTRRLFALPVRLLGRLRGSKRYPVRLSAS